MRALLDVNVLIALLDTDHMYHDAAHAWLGRELCHGWASCPITQIGCIRIMSQSGYPGAVPAQDVAARLGEAVADPAHTFWSDDIAPVIGMLRWNRILGHRQVTDAYLLALAVRNEGRFVTFDRRIDPSAAYGADSHNLVMLT